MELIKTNCPIDIKLIERNIGRSDKGYAELFKHYSNTHIYVTDVKHKFGYIWCPDVKLYSHISEPKLVGIISNTLEYILDQAIKFTEELLNHKLKKLKKRDEAKIQILKDEADVTIRQFKKEKFNVCGLSLPVRIYTYLLNLYYSKIMESVWDSAPNMLAVSGGKIVDLVTGSVRCRTHGDYFTVESPINYLGRDYTSPHTTKFLKDICCDNIDKFNYIRTQLGVSISNDTSQKCIHILYGEHGNNGKTLLTLNMASAFPEKYTAISENLMFAEKKDKLSTTDYGTLINKTMGVCSEPENRYCSSALIKLLSGGDSVIGKKLYCDQVSFIPCVKIFILLNNIIYIKEDKAGVMKKRTRVIELNGKFETNPDFKKGEKQADLKLKEKFMTPEYKNDFATFVINACIDFFENDKQVNVPQIIVDDTDNYFIKMDYFNKFLVETYIITKNLTDKVSKPDILTLYDQYCHDNELKFKKSMMTEYMDSKYGESKKGTDGTYYWHGLRCKTEKEINLLDRKTDDQVLEESKYELEQTRKRVKELKLTIKKLKSKVGKPEILIEKEDDIQDDDNVMSLNNFDFSNLYLFDDEPIIPPIIPTNNKPVVLSEKEKNEIILCFE